MLSDAQNTVEKNWDALYALAETQAGHFSAAQASKLGYYPQRLHKHLRARRIGRVRRGIYRLTHYPSDEHEQLVVYWLWSEQQGVFSGETALSLYELSDTLPHKLYLTLPQSWQERRLRVPSGLVLYYEDIPGKDTEWMGPVPVTKPKRTIEDCIEHHLQPDLVQQAIDQAKARGLITARTAKTLTKKAGFGR